MIKYVLIACLPILSLSDCPLNWYPRQTVTGYINAVINNDQKIHVNGSDYSYLVGQALPPIGISVAVSITGYEWIASEMINFSVKHLPTTFLEELKFRVKVSDKNYSWRLLKFGFFASQNSLFSVKLESEISSFSLGAEPEAYSLYRIIPGFQQFQIRPKIMVYISGISAETQSRNITQLTAMQDQLSSMRMFSTNPKIIKLLEQALLIKKGIFLKIKNARTIGNILGFNIETNLKLRWISFSYILLSEESILEKHNYVTGNVIMYDEETYKFEEIGYMDKLFFGIHSFSIPSNSMIELSIKYEPSDNFFRKATNKPYFQIGFTYFAVQMQRQYVCEDCPVSPIIYKQSFCVNECPKSYSKIQKFQTYQCQPCNIQELKFVDSKTQECVCADSHYLNIQTNKCQSCTYDCFTCSSKARCLTCDNELKQTKRVLNNYGRCACPILGYYDNEISRDIICRKCDKSCRTCNGPNPNNCLSCEEDKKLNHFGLCICENGFEQNKDGFCLCPSNKQLINGVCQSNAASCSILPNTQLNVVTKQCVCQSGFIQVLKQCIKCGRNSVFDEISLKCICINQTVFNGTQCVSCSDNEIYNEKRDKCQCMGSAFRSDDGSCITCPPKMGYYDGKCQCPFNYYENQGKCVRCKASSDGPRCKKNENLSL